MKQNHKIFGLALFFVSIFALLNVPAFAQNPGKGDNVREVSVCWNSNEVVNYGRQTPGETLVLKVNPACCPKLEGEVDIPSPIGWNGGGGCSRQLTFTAKIPKDKSGIHIGRFSGTMCECEVGKGKGDGKGNNDTETTPKKEWKITAITSVGEEDDAEGCILDAEKNCLSNGKVLVSASVVGAVPPFCEVKIIDEKGNVIGSGDRSAFAVVDDNKDKTLRAVSCCGSEKIDISKDECDDGGGGESDNCKVKLTGLSHKPNGGPDVSISPKIALNAQDAYKKAHWKLEIVKPDSFDSFKATITSTTDNVKFSKTKNKPFTRAINVESEGDVDFWVRSTKDAMSGTYKLITQVRIRKESNDTGFNEIVCRTTNKSTLFDFEIESISGVCGPETNERKVGDIKRISKCDSGIADPFWEELFVDVRLWPEFSASSEDADVNQKYRWKYKLVTDPSDSFEGIVKADTKIQAFVTGGKLAARGAGGFKEIGAAIVEVTMTNKISVEGLANGNGSNDTTRSVESPKFGLVIPDFIFFRDKKIPTTFRNDEARYKVGQTVTAEENLTVEIDREGVFADNGEGSGTAIKKGFDFVEFLKTIRGSYSITGEGND